MRRRLRVLLALTALGNAPDTVHLNQLGFRPDTAKRAIVADAAKAPLEIGRAHV